MEKRTLTCLLTQKERLARGADMSRAILDWQSANEEKKKITKELGDTIKEHEANMMRLGRIVRTGKEEREVDVEWRPFAESETMRLIRLDTGEEVQSRPMTREEKDLFRQESLPLSPPLQLPAAPSVLTTVPPRPAPAEEHQAHQLEDKSDVIDAEFEETAPSA